MIIISGAAGFIASCLVARLNEEGVTDLVLVDDFSKTKKSLHYSGKKYSKLVDRSEVLEWLKVNEDQVQFVFHLGARSDTTEFNKAIFDELNLEYSKAIWNICTKVALPLVYSSSADTCDDGAFVYDDRHDIFYQLKQAVK